MARTVDMTNNAAFDEAEFQAHLALGVKIMQNYVSDETDSIVQRFGNVIMQMLDQFFAQNFRLRTGLSMERLWVTFRPILVPEQQSMSRIAQILDLGRRFDKMRWKAASTLLNQSKAQSALEQSMVIARTDNAEVDELITGLTDAIESLETQAIVDAPAYEPYLVRQFDAIRQLAVLRSARLQTKNEPAVQGLMEDVDRTVHTLSNLPSKSSLLFAGMQGPASRLQLLDFLTVTGTKVWDGKFAVSTWVKLQEMQSVSLGALALVEAELPVLGLQIAKLSETIAEDPLLSLNEVLRELIIDTFTSFYPQAREAWASASSAASEYTEVLSKVLEEACHNIDALDMRRVSQEHLLPALKAIESAQHSEDDRAHFSALAWVHFSSGLVELFVPDRMFDPEIRPRMERDFHKHLLEGLEEKMAYIGDFEKRFTGQTSNLRTTLLRQEVDAIGPLPTEVLPVYRPEHSELGNLQAEFSNILKIIMGPSVAALLQQEPHSEPSLDELQLVKGNLERLLDRLGARFEAYQDLTQPASNLLRCMLVGLSIFEAKTEVQHPLSTPIYLAQVPFVRDASRKVEAPDEKCNSIGNLYMMGAVASIEGLDHITCEQRQAISECFHQFFIEWQQRLESDRKAEEAKTSLYRFRGSAEDEEEMDEHEFHELFPNYDEEEEKIPSVRREEVRDTSRRVADIHARIFGERSPDPAAAIHDLIEDATERVCQAANSRGFIRHTWNQRLLAGVTTLLQEKSSSLTSVVGAREYNFYTDANLNEARQLVVLTNKIKNKFRELQHVDEIGHMQPLADIVTACDKLLELVHSEPLAKILTRVEQLHALVYEWQFGGWASKIHGAPLLYDALTETIVSWRRLELSTWAKLLDMELNKCQDDARNWYFIAYEVVIAVPLSMVESAPDLRQYAISLVENLQLYFSTSIIGQFNARLQLLEQLQRHLHLLAQDHQSLSIITDAVTNFLSFYRRYGKTVQEAIAKGRMPIERKMKDVLLMASWKDTNINALRESARKSHQKLFRHVRKFRAVLGQEMKTIIEQGLPDIEPTAFVRAFVKLAEPNMPATAVQALKTHLPGWLEQHKRIGNMPQTVNIMRRVKDTVIENSSVSRLMDDFVTNLHDAAAELRKETPTTLTEENKSLVKHLKTRKRKLFADTLKSMRQMGLPFNLGQDRLVDQDSAAKIFAAVPPVQLAGDSSASAADYYFEKVVDLLPRVRDAAREHSEELTPAEVGRSVGFVEGILYLLLTQRKQLARAVRGLHDLQRTVQYFAAVGELQDDNVALKLRDASFDWHRRAAWLIHMLQYAITLVKTHETLGQDATNVTELLQNNIDALRKGADELTVSKQLPDSLTTERASRQEHALGETFLNVRQTLTESLQERPSLGYIIDGLLPWTEVEVQNAEQSHEAAPLQAFGDALSTLCDKVLVSTERAKKTCGRSPVQETDGEWLAKNNEAVISTINGLRMNTVQNETASCLSMIPGAISTSLSNSFGAVAATRLVTPILQQYAGFCKSMVESLCDNHRATAQMGFKLTSIFLQMSAQGFCSPQEKSDEESGADGKVESGTGLGDGDGAEDISKDIQEDEDLSELAQEANKDESGDVEDEKDAVDMADEDMEGEMGSVAGDEDEDDEKKDGDDQEEGEDDIDEEAGDVDDLDPTAIDEKMWDGKDEEEAEKDQQGDKASGQKKDDEQMASEEQQQKKDEAQQEPDTADTEDSQPEGDEAEDVDDEKEEVKDAEMNRQEQTAEENDALALPEEMDLDLDEEASESEDDGMDDLSDVHEDKLDDAQRPGEDGEDDGDGDEEVKQEHEEDDHVSEAGVEEDQADGKDDGQPTDDVKEEEEEEPDHDEPLDEKNEQAPESADQGATDLDNAAPSDVRGSGEDQNAEAMEMDQQFQSNAAQQEEGKSGDAAADQAATAGKDGKMSRSDEPMERGEPEADDSQPGTNDPFKKLGDALEQWHRQRSDIQQADAEQDAQPKHDPDQSQEQAHQEFQHLQNDDDAADTQAMGTAKEDEVQPIDESMGIDDDREDPGSRLLDDATAEEQVEKNVDAMDEDDKPEASDDVQAQTDAEDGRSGVQTRQGNHQRENTPSEEEAVIGEQEDQDETIEEASTQLSNAHITEDGRPLREYDEAAQQWSDFQNKTHALSLSLTSQLRLILTPSQTTKLSGSFRTGKRLNIKRIIPYIASSYKRDKIWMRRSIPTKRTYQILLCVDDSKSMGESSSGQLAMESLVMVSRSLTMLEAGQVGVLCFGGDVFPAHSLTEPFASDAGAKVLQNFTFSQDKTDVALLIRNTIDTFKEARQQTSGAGSDLWQLALILSDGLTPSSAHDSIRRLLREAIEERIMIVFIIMDDTEKKKGDSVLELKEAKFVSEGGESRVVIERYLDTFPFQYYLIVHNLEDLPGALAGLLRTWFAEVTA